MTMKKIYFLIITFSLVTSVQAAHKKKPKTPPVTIPGKVTPNSSSPSSGSYTSGWDQTPRSWDTDKNDGNLTEALADVTSETDQEGHLRFVSPLTSPRGDNDEGPTQKKSCCTKFFCYFCCCCRKKKTSSEYAAIS